MQILQTLLAVETREAGLREAAGKGEQGCSLVSNKEQKRNDDTVYGSEFGEGLKLSD